MVDHRKNAAAIRAALAKRSPAEIEMARRITERLNADPTIRALFAPTRQPRYRFFKLGDRRFCWSTERMPDGKYTSWEYAPVGKGSRSGKAEEWKPRNERRFRTRTAAKARALKLYRAAKVPTPSPDSRP